MVKENVLSSDIDIVKEFEELKIKQRLLIQSLKNKTNSEENSLFLEINSKLDFLVKIFVETQTPSEDENAEDNAGGNDTEDEQTSTIVQKLDLLSKSFDDKFSNINIEIKKINSKLTNNTSAISNNPNESNAHNSNSNANLKSANDLDGAPIPSFVSRIDADKTNSLDANTKTIEPENIKVHSENPENIKNNTTKDSQMNENMNSKKSTEKGTKVNIADKDETKEKEIKKKSKKWF